MAVKFNMLANKTTTVDAVKTVGEIQAMLAKAGASHMLIEYESGQPVALSFKILGANNEHVNFRLPCNWQGILKALKGQVPRRLQNHEHAHRVGWRIIKDWLRAQLSLIAAGASTLEEVMLPWALMVTGNTVGTEMLLNKRHLLALPAPATSREPGHGS